MRYQLVLKFKRDPAADFRQVVAVTDALMNALAGSAEVDGHHFGSGGVNIFIWTADPRATFKRARPLLERGELLDGLTAAYRPRNGKRYTLIWPETLKEE